MLRRLFALNFLLCWLSAPLAAHEFWIEPQDYTLSADQQLIASIRVGERFGGSGYSFNPRTFRRFEIVTQGKARPVPGRPGDRPAVNMPAPGPGLAVLVHETNDLRLSYAEIEKFENFLRHKDWLPLLEDHKARGLPDGGFRERYSRYGKSLVAVGDGRGQDQNLGLTTEIIALANPYTDAVSELPVRVLYRGAARANAQVELFEKAPDGSVAITLHRTDADGVARLPVKPKHSYLVDAVVIRPIESQEDGDPVWESLWASLTFAVP